MGGAEPRFPVAVFCDATWPHVLVVYPVNIGSCKWLQMAEMAMVLSTPKLCLLTQPMTGIFSQCCCCKIVEQQEYMAAHAYLKVQVVVQLVDSC